MTEAVTTPAVDEPHGSAVANLQSSVGAGATASDAAASTSQPRPQKRLQRKLPELSAVLVGSVEPPPLKRTGAEEATATHSGRFEGRWCTIEAEGRKSLHFRVLKRQVNRQLRYVLRIVGLEDFVLTRQPSQTEDCTPADAPAAEKEAAALNGAHDVAASVEDELSGSRADEGKAVSAMLVGEDPAVPESGSVAAASLGEGSSMALSAASADVVSTVASSEDQGFSFADCVVITNAHASSPSMGTREPVQPVGGDGDHEGLLATAGAVPAVQESAATNSQKEAPDGRVWYVSEPVLREDVGPVAIQIRMSSAGEDGITLQTLSEDGGTWTELQARRIPCLHDCVSRPSVVKVTSETCYSPESAEALHSGGWYVPTVRLKRELQTEAQTGATLYPGLAFFEVHWLGELGPNGEGFSFDPGPHNIVANQTYLVTYVGTVGGILSDTLHAACMFLDMHFDGLCILPVMSLDSLVQDDFELAAIVGPSGSGKSSIASENFGRQPEIHWVASAPLRAHMPTGVVSEAALQATGLSGEVAGRLVSDLSGGELFRARLARMLVWHFGRSATKGMLVIDDFTSALDRKAARELACSMQVFLKRYNIRRVVVLTCHADVIGRGRLEPEWVFEVPSKRLIFFRDQSCQKTSAAPAISRNEAVSAAPAISRNEAVPAIEQPGGQDYELLLRERASLATMQSKLTGLSAMALRMSPPFSFETAKAMANAIVERAEADYQEAEERLAKLEAKVREAGLPDCVEDQSELFNSLASSSVLDSIRPRSANFRLEVCRACPCEWTHFREHHHKDAKIAQTSVMFVARLFGEPVALTALIPVGGNIFTRFTRKKTRLMSEWRSWRQANYPEAWLQRTMWREHRTVVLPSFQGLGIGSLLADVAAYVCEVMGHAFISMSRHPHYGGYRDRSPFWVALPTREKDNTVNEGLPMFSHAWVGAKRADGTEDPRRLKLLDERMDLRGLQSILGSCEVEEEAEGEVDEEIDVV
eukprot:TRINITY_DN13347_c0_g1_i2.p1 TRINITY_DN13347_c0_g1~~TRINITY_DN13347_c0_g1_i2.p1  ORF type:complete len:1024 (-),score=204.35 TRINITY_DN13347_c0_g1_i2:103-3069(-)